MISDKIKQYGFLEFTMTDVDYVAELKIDLEIGGKNAEEIIGMYEASILDDINQTAWNLCDCNDQIQSEKFENPTIINYELESLEDSKVRATVVLRVTGNDPEFIEKVINEYMEGFEDWIGATRNGYYSRTGSRVGTDIKVKDWELDTKLN